MGLPDSGTSTTPRAVPMGISDLVEGALWIAALDTVPIEDRIEKVEQWMRAVDAVDLWRYIEETAE